MVRLSKNTRNSISLNITSAQYLAKKLLSLLSLLRSEQHSIEYVLAKRLTFKLFNFIELRLTHQIISVIFIAIP